MHATVQGSTLYSCVVRTGRRVHSPLQTGAFGETGLPTSSSRSGTCCERNLRRVVQLKSAVPTAELRGPVFLPSRGQLVRNFASDAYLAKNWELLRVSGGPSQNGGFFAKKSYERTKVISPVQTLTEETHLFLKHTPEASMPDCR